MAQKILAGRAADPTLAGSLIEVKVDQVVLARDPQRGFSEGLQAGLKRTSAEVAIAYDGHCVTDAHRARGERPGGAHVPLSMLAHGLLVARAGVGFPSVVHLERFASPARLCVTDDPRLAGVGGAGMLSMVVPPGLLGQALAKGTVWLRPPRSIQVLLAGRVRPFVCARDVALELLRRGLGDIVRKVEEQYRAPVVIEFAGPSARLLSVGERAVLCALAPQLGAAAAVFVSDERTEVFLRDQRRSKAHRALSPDAGAPCDDVLNLDLGAVDPLLLDEAGVVRPVRDLAGKPVAQVLLGGDSGVTLRDLFAAATLLKSKRVPSKLDLLLAVPSRQMLEVLSSSGVLTDLIATGARLVEPDARMMDGALYPPARVEQTEAGLTMRTCDPEPRGAPFVVASAETLACAVATGEVGDPRSFKRPVRVTVPRALPTDDVLVARERRAGGAGAKEVAPVAVARVAWRAGQALELVSRSAFTKMLERPLDGARADAAALGVVCTTLDDVRDVASRSAELAPLVRAVIAPFIPSGIVALLSGLGIAAMLVDAVGVKALEGEGTLALPAPAQWGDGEVPRVRSGATGGKSGASGKAPEVPLRWLAIGAERSWMTTGSASPGREPVKSAARAR